LVLYKTTMPAVLIETGFLSNNTEEKYLRSDEGQSLIASAIYRAFKEYKQSMEVQ
jgi:N-acetylmuramoyl-L-alanine amidase